MLPADSLPVAKKKGIRKGLGAKRKGAQKAKPAESLQPPSSPQVLPEDISPLQPGSSTSHVLTVPSPPPPPISPISQAFTESSPLIPQEPSATFPVSTKYTLPVSRRTLSYFQGLLGDVSPMDESQDRGSALDITPPHTPSQERPSADAHMVTHFDPPVSPVSPPPPEDEEPLWEPSYEVNQRASPTSAQPRSFVNSGMPPVSTTTGDEPKMGDYFTKRRVLLDVLKSLHSTG